MGATLPMLCRGVLHYTKDKRKARIWQTDLNDPSSLSNTLTTTMGYSKNTFHLAIFFISHSSLNLMKTLQSLMVIGAIIFCVAAYNLIT